MRRLRVFLEFPLLRRELVGLLRLGRAFWLLVACVGVASFVTLVVWPTGTAGPQGYWKTTEVFFQVVVYQSIACILVIPAFTAGAISGERERGTYELLHSTRLSPWSIVASKAIAQSCYVGLLLVSSAPLICLLYLLGGIEFGTVLKCYAITFAAVVTSGLVCLTVSMRSRRTVHAVIRGVVWVVFYNIGLFLLISIVLFPYFTSTVGSGTGVDDNVVVPTLMGLSPFFAMGETIWSVAGPGGEGGVRSWVVFLVYSGGLSSAHVWYLLWAARLPDVARISPHPTIPAGPADRAPRRPYRSFLLRAVLRGGYRHRWLANPVLQKALRSEFIGRPGYQAVLFFPALALLPIIYLVGTGGDGVHPGAVAFAGALALFFVLAITVTYAATALTRESEGGHLDLLRGTLLSMASMVRGKLAAATLGSLGITAAAVFVTPIAVLALGLPYYEGDVGRFLETCGRAAWIGAVLAVILGASALFAGALGTFFSAVFRSSIGALLGAYLTLVGLEVGLPLVGRFVLEWFFPGGGGVAPSGFRSPGSVLVVLNPFSTLFVCVGRALRPEASLGWPVAALGLFAVVHTGASGVLLYAAQAVYARLRGRDR